jgi:hypothetical protein
MAKTKLTAAIESLASSFASSLLHAIRDASLDEIVTESAGARVPARGSARARGGRLQRRSAKQIAATLDRIHALLKRSNGGLRAEAIREALKLHRKELPIPLAEGLRTRRLRKTGRKRATTYYAR